MSKSYSDLKVSGDISIQGNKVLKSVSANGSSPVLPDSTGKVTLDIVDKSTVNNFFANIPLSRYGLLNQSSSTATVSNYVITFPNSTPVFLNGIYYEFPANIAVDLKLVDASPANKTFYIYVRNISGTLMYVASTTEVAESETNMYIFKYLADGTTSITVPFISRLYVYRPSLTQIGSAFPVSSGNPSSTGTIGW